MRGCDITAVNKGLACYTGVQLFSWDYLAIRTFTEVMTSTIVIMGGPCRKQGSKEVVILTAMILGGSCIVPFMCNL